MVVRLSGAWDVNEVSPGHLVAFDLVELTPAGNDFDTFDGRT